MMKTEIQNSINYLESTGQFRVLKKLNFTKTYNTPKPEIKLKKACMLDVETTGLKPNLNGITNLAMFQFRYDDDGNIYDIIAYYDGFNDPGDPITPQIQKMTSITPELVKGKTLDIAKVDELFRTSEFIIAHNAEFDRAFVDKVIPSSKDCIWCCTQRDIPWRDFQVDSAKLTTIGIHYGFFYDSHRARPDVLAGIEVLSRSEDGKRNMSWLIESATSKQFLVCAKYAPKEKNDSLKLDGDYRWNPAAMSWAKLVRQEQIEHEKQFLDKIYPTGKNQSVIVELARKELYKKT